VDFDENGGRSSDGMQVGELLEYLSHKQLSKKECGRHYVLTKFDSSSIIQSVSAQQRVWVYSLCRSLEFFHGNQIKVEKRTALFWDITQRVVVIS
jgi:hypothetical protein